MALINYLRNEKKKTSVSNHNLQQKAANYDYAKYVNLKMKYIYFFLVLFFFSMANLSLGQNLLGIVNSNYSGSSGVILNPSSFTNSKLDFDLNLITFGGHIQTDYGFIDKNKYNPINPFKNGFTDFSSYEMYNTNRDGYLNGNIMLYLPSFMKTVGNHSFGFFCDYRFESNTTQVPINIIRCLYGGHNLPQDTMKNMHSDKFNFGLMAWGELGGTYSQKVIDDNEKILVAGVNIKLLESNFGAFCNTRKVDYDFPNANDIDIDNIDVKFGIADVSSGKIKIYGYGMGTDLGVSYYKKNSNAASNLNQSVDFANYKYKIGLSIIDIGAIGFKNSYMYDVNTYTDHSIIANNTTNKDSLTDLNNSGLTSKRKLYIVLPTAVSLQFDYNVNNKIYVSSVVTQNLKVFGDQLRRPSLIAICPRYESRKFEVSIPLSIYDYKIPRIGISLRYRSITIGTEKVGWLFKFNNYTGMDGYISIHYFIGQKDRHNPVSTVSYSTTKTLRSTNKKSLTIGQSYGGGVIFYIDSTGQHGLIAAPSDQSTGNEWGCEGISINGAKDTVSGKGNQNTIAIVSDCKTPNIAAEICRNLVLNGYSDWFLPSKSELSLMYQNRDAIGGFTGNHYWSSSQYNNSSTLAWDQNFANGSQGYNHKSNKYYVRAIRAF